MNENFVDTEIFLKFDEKYFINKINEKMECQIEISITQNQRKFIRKCMKEIIEELNKQCREKGWQE